MHSHLVHKVFAGKVPRRTFLIGLAVAVVLAGCSKPNVSEMPLVVGMDLSYPPFETINATGRPEGVSVELAKALADYLHRPLRIENIPFVGLIPSLKSGRIDCVISSMTDTEERRKSITFSDPYLSTGLAFLTGKETGLRSIADADQPGRIIVVRQGTTGEVWARQHIKQARVLSLEKENSAVLEVIQGTATAFIYDQMSIWQNWQNNKSSTQAVLEPIQKESWAIGLRQGDDALRQQINSFLDTYRKNGGFEKLGDQFLKTQKDAFEQRGIPFYF